MRAGRVVMAAAIVAGWSVPGPAYGADPPYGPPVTACTVTDPRIAESSGLVVDGSRLLTVNDGGHDLTVYGLDAACSVTSVLTAATDPFDVEDLARAADGTLWLSDTGDNSAVRDTVALESLTQAGVAVVYRLRYPDGAHDAEALLLDSHSRPLIVTKTLSGRSGVYAPDGDLSATATVPLRRVAEVPFVVTGTPGGPVGTAGQVLVTGGAVSPDGTRLALRTYTDAYVYAAPDGDVLAALASVAVRVALPPAPQGEAIAFGANGRDLVLTSEGSPFDVTVVPASDPEASTSTRSAPGRAVTASSPQSRVAVNLVVAGLVAALLVWVAGRARRR